MAHCRSHVGWVETDQRSVPRPNTFTLAALLFHSKPSRRDSIARAPHSCQQSSRLRAFTDRVSPASRKSPARILDSPRGFLNFPRGFGNSSGGILNFPPGFLNSSAGICLPRCVTPTGITGKASGFAPGQRLRAEGPPLPDLQTRVNAHGRLDRPLFEELQHDHPQCDDGDHRAK